MSMRVCGRTIFFKIDKKIVAMLRGSRIFFSKQADDPRSANQNQKTKYEKDTHKPDPPDLRN